MGQILQASFDYVFLPTYARTWNGWGRISMASYQDMYIYETVFTSYSTYL